jgi:protein ImuB
MFAVIYIRAFSLQAVLRIEPERVGLPVALMDATGRSPRILACTASALAAGVEPGQTAPQAMARCASVVLRTVQPEAEAEARAALLAAAGSISPQVEDTAPGVCTLQVAGVFPEKRETVIQAALAQLQQLGLTGTAGLAATPLLALYAAREASGRGEEPRGSATELNAESCVNVKPGSERDFLRDLPLSVAEPPIRVAEILAGWGVRTLGDMTALTKADVTQRLGPEGLALWERASGEVMRPLRLLIPAPTFVAEMTLEYEIETLEPLLFVLRRFIDRLALDLRNAGFVAGELVLGLILADETAHTRVFRLPEPTAREESLFRVLHTHLESLHTAATVRGVSLECRPVRPLTRQQGLFENALRDPHGFAETLARVSALVGANRVGTPQRDNTHRPDAVTLSAPAAVVAPPEARELHPRRGLPLRRYRPAFAATVELNGVVPAFVWTVPVRGVVTGVRGPWRGSGEWWDAVRWWRREEWDVELDTGGVYRLLHEPDGWFLEGEYD